MVLDHILIFSISISLFNSSICNVAVNEKLKRGSDLQLFYLNNQEEDNPRTKYQSNKEKQTEGHNTGHPTEETKGYKYK